MVSSSPSPHKASCFASALAYGLVHAKTSIHNCKLLFLVGEYSIDSHFTVVIV